MKSLIVGDMHVQPNNLKESKDIFDFILKTTEKHEIKRIIFLGDLNHTHGIIRVECLYFWDECFKNVPKDVQVEIIIGNHDKILGNSDHAGKHSLREFVNKFSNINIMANTTIIDGIVFIPYIHDESEFMEAINEANCETAICHQTFNGATYENGFYAKDGFDLTKIRPEVKNIVSGHIHTEASFERVWYPGNPRWLTNSEANQDKGIWIVNLENPKEKEFISTRGVATSINKYEIKEGEVIPQFNLSDRNFVQLTGTSVWCGETKKKIPSGVSVKTVFTDKKQTKFDNQQMPNLNQYLQNSFTLSGISDTIKIKELKLKIKEYLDGIH